MQAQGKLFDGEVPRYKSTFSAFKEIIQTQGLQGLYTGVGPTVKRAAILTATQVSAPVVSIRSYCKCKLWEHWYMAEWTFDLQSHADLHIKYLLEDVVNEFPWLFP